MTLTAFLHGYPPGWAMGGEVSTHRTLREVPGSVVFTECDEEYELDGVRVLPRSGTRYADIVRDAASVEATVLYAHSSMSTHTVQAAKGLDLPSILAVHAPQKYGTDLRRAWKRATARLYNTSAARRDWNDPEGWLLHPPMGSSPAVHPNSPHDAWTLTSSLMNKGVTETLVLAKRWPDQRFIIVESPAHTTHGSPEFWDMADVLPNVEVWSRMHPDSMHRLWAETRVLLVPSRYETYGLSAVEAASYGIPAVHVDTIHVREGIGDAARLIGVRDVGELEQAVLEVEGNYDVWSHRARVRSEELAVREQRELQRFAAQVAALTG